MAHAGLVGLYHAHSPYVALHFLLCRLGDLNAGKTYSFFINCNGCKPLNLFFFRRRYLVGLYRNILHTHLILGRNRRTYRGIHRVAVEEDFSLCA